MKQLKNGQFFGSHYQKNVFEGITLTDTEYTHEKVDWHYHENPYFTYLIQGGLYEENKKNSYKLKPGSILYHHWQDSHKNIKAPSFTRGFHIELKQQWFQKHDLPVLDYEGSKDISKPIIQSFMNRILLETKVNDTFSQASIEMLLLDSFNHFGHTASIIGAHKLTWLKQLDEILTENPKDLSLTALSEELNIHPVHLSRQFHKKYKVTLGQYRRHLRLNSAVSKIIEGKQTLTEITYECGFFDQSHLISDFKKVYKCTPRQFSKKIEWG